MTEINPEVLGPFDVEPDPMSPEQSIAALRFVRNNMLAATDWMAVQDRTMTQAERDYRQALRDITETYQRIEDVVWPSFGGNANAN